MTRTLDRTRSAMTKEATIERRWQRMVADESESIRTMAARLIREPELRTLFPFVSVDTLFRFSETTEWPYTVLPFLEHNLDDMSFEVRVMGVVPVTGHVIAKGTLEEMVPVLVHEVGLALKMPRELFRH